MLRKNALRVFALVSPFFLIGCLLGDDVTGPQFSLWDGDLLPTQANITITGDIAAVVDRIGTTVGIAIIGGAEGSTHGWALHTGSCAEPGAVFGPESAFGPLHPDEDGGASAETFINERMDPSGSYSVRVSGTGERADEVIACGDLRRRSAPSQD